MSSSALEGISDTRSDSNRELVGQGIGNLASSLFGSIASAGSIIRSHANVRAGGRGRMSGVSVQCGPFSYASGPLPL